MAIVSLVRCGSYDDNEVYSAVKKSVELIGGLGIKEGSSVLVKPNLLRPSVPKKAVSTHPAVIRAIIKILKEKNCTVYVGDSPGFHDPIATAKICGILRVCEEEGAIFVDFKKGKIYLYKEAMLMKRFELSNIVGKVDYIINVPKLKTHVMMGVSFAIKNTFGFMVGLSKSKMHLKLSDKEQFASMLVDLNNFVKPCLNIMDGVVGMEGDGPGNGDPKSVGVISACADSLAMDITMCKLVGVDPISILTNKIGLKTKEADFIENISVVGEKLEDVTVKFRPAPSQKVTFFLPKQVSSFLNSILSSRPVINQKKCKACSECIKICPAKTIIMEELNGKKAAFIKKEKCIMCYCCHEICPYDAIVIKKGIFKI